MQRRSLVTEGVEEKELKAEDKPGYSLHSETLVLHATEAFAFSAEVHPGYFHIKASNESGSVLTAGAGPTATVRVLVSDPRPWSKPWRTELAIPAAVSGHPREICFSINQAATLEVFVQHNVQRNPVWRTCKVVLDVNSSHRKEHVSISAQLPPGVHPADVVQKCWDHEEVILPRLLRPSPTALCDAVSALQGHTATGIGGQVLVFGGETGGEATNRLIVFDPEERQLHEVHERSGPAHGILSPTGSPLASPVADPYSFRGVPPLPRLGHTANVWSGKLCIFGGFSAGTPLADVRLLDLENFSWSPIVGNPTEIPFLARGFHSAVVHKDKLYVYGGCTDLALAKLQQPGGWVNSPLWTYSFRAAKWEELGAANTPHNNGKVYGHSAVAGDRCFYVFGGITQEGLSNQLYRFQLEQKQWTRLDTTGFLPSPRAFASIWKLDTASAATNLRLSWPCPKLESAELGANTAQPLEALCVFGGAGSSDGTHSISVLLLCDFRGHDAFYWHRLTVADSALPTAPSSRKWAVPKLPARSPAAQPAAPKVVTGNYAVFLYKKQLNVVSLGIGYPVRQLPDDLPPIMALSGVHPLDYVGCFSSKVDDKDLQEFEGKIRQAFEEFEACVGLIKVQIKSAQRLGGAQPQDEFKELFAIACSDLRSHIRRANRLALRFPPDVFGTKAGDLLAMFEVLQQQASVLNEASQKGLGMAPEPRHAPAALTIPARAQSTEPEPRTPVEIIRDMRATLDTVSAAAAAGKPLAKADAQAEVPPAASPAPSGVSSSSGARTPRREAEPRSATDGNPIVAQFRQHLELLGAQVRVVRMESANQHTEEDSQLLRNSCAVLHQLLQQSSVLASQLPPTSGGVSTSEIIKEFETLDFQARQLLETTESVDGDAHTDGGRSDHAPRKKRGPASLARYMEDTIGAISKPFRRTSQRSGASGSSSHTLPAPPPLSTPVGASTADLQQEFDRSLTLLYTQVMTVRKLRGSRNKHDIAVELPQARNFLKQLVAHCSTLSTRTVIPQDLQLRFGELVEAAQSCY